MTKITQEQFDQMVRGSMARGIAYEGDPSTRRAQSRVNQMLDRAGIQVEKPLDVPEPGRKMRVTLRNGEQRTVSTTPRYTTERYIKYTSEEGVAFLDLIPNPLVESPEDIVAWEYVKRFTVGSDDGEFWHVYEPNGDRFVTLEKEGGAQMIADLFNEKEGL